MGGSKNEFIDPQPAPREGTNQILPLLVSDLFEKSLRGQMKYGRPLEAFNGRDPAIDAYQEILDLALYFRQLLEEREGVMRVIERSLREHLQTARAAQEAGWDNAEDETTIKAICADIKDRLFGPSA